MANGNSLATRLSIGIKERKNLVSQFFEHNLSPVINELAPLFIPFINDRRIHQAAQGSLALCKDKKTRAAIYTSEVLVFLTKYGGWTAGSYIIVDYLAKYFSLIVFLKLYKTRVL